MIYSLFFTVKTALNKLLHPASTTIYSSSFYSLTSCSSSQIELLYHEPNYTLSDYDHFITTNNKHRRRPAYSTLTENDDDISDVHHHPHNPNRPPPLPKRNSVLVPAPGHSLHYGPDGQLRLHSGDNTLSGFARKSSLPAHLSYSPSLLVTHELNLARQTPLSEEESLILESKQYVREIKARRDNIHKTLVLTTHPGKKVQNMLGYRLEQRLVRAMSKKRKPSMKSRRRNRRKRGWKNRLFKMATNTQPSRFFRRVRRKFSGRRAGFVRVESDVDEDLYGGDSEHRSDIATPCLVVDKTGTLRWPRLQSSHRTLPGAPHTHNNQYNNKLFDSDNFMLFNPSLAPAGPDGNAEDSGPQAGGPGQPTGGPGPQLRSRSPAVLGWLQVNPDSHIFTPAVEKGPFRKVPFHPHLHVLKR